MVHASPRSAKSVHRSPPPLSHSPRHLAVTLRRSLGSLCSFLSIPSEGLPVSRNDRGDRVLVNKAAGSPVSWITKLSKPLMVPDNPRSIHQIHGHTGSFPAHLVQENILEIHLDLPIKPSVIGNKTSVPHCTIILQLIPTCLNSMVFFICALFHALFQPGDVHPSGAGLAAEPG